LIVIDASLALDIAVISTAGAALRDRIIDDGRALAAPDLIELEVPQALRRLVRIGTIGSARAAEAIRIFGALRIERFPHAPIGPRVWALRENLTAYDAAYFALAELLDAPLWTRDAKFRSAPGHNARVVVM